MLVSTIRNAFVSLLWLCALANAQQPATPVETNFTRPAIQREMFREGEVRRVESTFQNWRLICDEVPRLKHRFCSLFGAVRDSEGRVVGELTVSSSEDGRLGALLRMPTGVSIRHRVQISMPPADQPSAKKPVARAPQPANGEQLAIVSCDPGSCITLWPLTSPQIQSLNNGKQLKTRFYIEEAGKGPVPTSRLFPYLIGNTFRFQEVNAVIDGSGFADCVKASLAPIEGG